MLRIFTLSIIYLTACNQEEPNQTIDFLNSDTKEIISLNGEWQFSLVNIKALGSLPELEDLKFADKLNLPGTLAENRKGILNTNKEEWKNLSEEFMFQGTSFYKRTIHIPEDWQDKRIAFRMDRTRKTAVWLNRQLIGINPSISSAQLYELGNLNSGEYELIVAVDNVVKQHPAGKSHMNVKATQTNWNGILGKIQLEATPKVWISRIRIFPNIVEKTALLELTLNNNLEGKQTGKIKVTTESFNSDKQHTPKDVSINFSIEESKKTIKALIKLGDKMLTWDEFDPALYRSKISLMLNNGNGQQLTRTFGMRTFTQNGSQFVVNGNKTFLRGKHDACVFPLTGYAPMDVKEWVRILNIANHYRFHTWCPPEAALAAADIVGIYMQPELPCWGELDAQERGKSFKDINAVAFGAEKMGNKEKYDPTIPTEAEKFYHKEAEQILDNFGNYASFVMFAIGNELKGNRVVMKRLVDRFREYDNNRRLYSQGSNNYFANPQKGETDDYWTTVRTSDKTWENYDNNTRISYCMVDQYDGGLVNVQQPSTRVNFSKAIESTDVPVIGHETGQYSY